MNQARALGAAFKGTPFTAIHSSTLKRAQMTAQAIHDAQKAPKPPLITSPLLREQNFGIAEGKPWISELPGVSIEDHFSQGLYPRLRDPKSKFPEGESLEDLRSRAELAMKEILFPYLWQTEREGASVVVVSHGLFINEIVAALLRQDFGGGNRVSIYIGLRNAAWTRVTVKVKGIKDRDSLEDLPPLEVRVTDLNRNEHTTDIIRQKGGIGSQRHDPKQKDIRSFFGGC